LIKTQKALVLGHFHPKSSFTFGEVINELQKKSYFEDRYYKHVFEAMTNALTFHNFKSFYIYDFFKIKSWEIKLKSNQQHDIHNFS